jgi:hypothetical protein
MPIQQPSERSAIVSVVNPVNNNNATANSAAIDMSKFHEAMFILLLGSVDSTTDCKIQESADGSTNWGDISGKAITQLGAADDNKQAVINLKTSEMTKRYARAVVTSGNGTTNLLALVALGQRPRVGPASGDNLNTVAQIVT